jgi:hypothetical protein
MVSRHEVTVSFRLSVGSKELFNSTFGIRCTRIVIEKCVLTLLNGLYAFETNLLASNTGLLQIRKCLAADWWYPYIGKQKDATPLK